ncbi:MAG: ABC transporter substrate-binding protein [Acidimicrobiales bacterium]|jgi:peptide/nickel transport system substrate-binding protein
MFRATLVLLLGGSTLVALGGVGAANASQKSTSRVHASSKGGVVTYAEQPGTTLNWIFPLIPDSYALTNISQFEDIMWRPLYWLGTNTGEALWNSSLSLAYPPVFSDGNKVVTMKLKNYEWSNGKPVTSRDVEFWILLMKAAIKINPGYWGGYVKGYFPDNVVSVKTPNPSTVVLTLNKGYSSIWYWYNELSQITPIPQAAWDKTSANGPVGNYDLTPTGATAVYNFLAGQSKDLSTYTTNPLWKVVDGPWNLTGFTTTSRLTFVPNPRYSGPVKPTISEFIEEPFTSDTAEFDALEAGDVDYGYVPYTDVPAIGAIKARGYNIAPWQVWAVNYTTINFSNPKVGKIFGQLYIRQAMQSLVDQPTYIKAALDGYGTPTYGVIPDDIPSSYITPQQAKDNPYPYDPAKAVQLLRSHGWKIVPNGTDTCIRPGTGASDCGAGIAAGTPISFKLLYASGFQYLNVEMETYKTAMDQAGMQLSLSEAPVDDVLGSATVCTPSQSDCGWQMLNWEFGYVLVPNYDPTGEQQYKAGAASNFGSFNDPALNSIIEKTNLPGGQVYMAAYAKLAAQELPDIFFPEAPYQISAIKSTLTGVLPQNPEEDFTPENWRLNG